MPETSRESLAGLWSPSPLGHPTSIAEYRILGIVGTGGMGTVYAAEQEYPKRTVALKVIRSEFASGDTLRRFAREAEALGRLQHPGIARIYAAGDADGVPYFAMELVSGRTLTDYADAECRDLAQRLELFARICDAVQYAHHRGVIHRDLKPANILVDDAGQPKVLDFGVARLTETDSTATMKTDVGVVVGTLQYMSPEQVAGDPLDIDTRSDIYALGVILYELLAKQLPYSWKGAGIAQAAHVIIMTEPASLGSIDRRFRGDIETIAAKALEKDKARRYASAAGLASDIRRYLHDEPITARPVSAAYQLRKLVRRHRAVVVGLGVAAFALVAGTVVSVAMAVRANAASRLAESRRGDAEASQALAEQRRGEAERGRSAADAARLAADSARQDAVRQQAAALASSRRAEAEASKARATSSFLQDMLRSTNPDFTEGRNVTVKDVVDRAGHALSAGRLADQPTVRADVYSTLAETYRAIAAYDSALVYFDSAYAINARTLGPVHGRTVSAALDGALVATDKRDLPAAERRYRAALEAARQVRPPRIDLVVEGMHRLAFVVQLSGRDAESDSLGAAAVALARQTRVSDTTTINAVRRLAAIRTFARRARDAEPLWREVVDYHRRVDGERSMSTLTAIIELGYNVAQQGRHADAEALLRPTLPTVRAVYGDHPTVASVLERLGNSVVALGRRDEGVAYLREAIAMRIKVLGEQHADVQLARVTLGRALVSHGKYAEAESLFVDALRARTATFGMQHGAVASSIDELGALAAARRNYVGAAQRYREAMAVWQAAKLPQWEARSQSELGDVLMRADSLVESERMLREALTKQRSIYGAEHADVFTTTTRLGSTLRRRGGALLVEAESLFRVALAGRRKLLGPTSPQLILPLEGVARVREQVGDTTGALPFLRELVTNMSAARPATDSTLLARKSWFGTMLCATGSVGEGERIAREILTTTSSDSTNIRAARATIDACRARASKPH